MDRCLREIAAIEAELFAGNPDILGLLLAYADWHAELRILQDEEHRHCCDRRVHDEHQPQNPEIGGRDLTA